MTGGKPFRSIETDRHRTDIIVTKLLSAVLYILVLLPIWLMRKITGRSRFGRRLHLAPTSWDRLVVPKSPSPLSSEQRA